MEGPYPAATIRFDHLMAEAGHPLRGPGAIELAGDTIRAVGAGGAPGGGVLALPALANAHDHGRGLRALAFGARDDALEVWIADLGLEPATDPYTRAAVCFARMAEAGIGAANHCHQLQNNPDLASEAAAVARAARDVGIRIAFAVPIAGRNPVAYGDPAPLLRALSPSDAARLEAAPAPPFAEQIDRVDDLAALEHPCFTVQYGPVAPQWVDDAALATIAERSAATGRRVHMHLLETRYQRQWADATYPRGLVAHLDSIGLLSPRLTVAHGVWLHPDECALLAARGVAVSLNTSSNLRLRSGTAPVAQLVAAGAAFGLGLDGMALDDDEDMLREARLAFLMHRGGGTVDVLTPERLWRALVADGRRSILGDDGGGRIAPGAPADVLVLDTAAIGGDVLPGRVDPLDLVLARGTKRAVKDLYVAGRKVVADGRCTGIDLPAAAAALKAEAAAAPPFDAAAQSRISAAIAHYYRCGCHLPEAAR